MYCPCEPVYWPLVDIIWNTLSSKCFDNICLHKIQYLTIDFVGENWWEHHWDTSPQQVLLIERIILESLDLQNELIIGLMQTTMEALHVRASVDMIIECYNSWYLHIKACWLLPQPTAEPLLINHWSTACMDQPLISIYSGARRA